MHPAHQAFHDWLRDRTSALIGQVWIGIGDSFELRHVLDRNEDGEGLKPFDDPWAARELAGATDSGRYRPLKSAPNLRRGWRIVRLDMVGLITALDCFYPGAIAMWHAWRMGKLQFTSYRTCAARQTGMYRITALLTDAQVEWVAGCACSDRSCLKVPLWTKPADGKPSRAGDEVSIPCPEPCSMLLSLARKVARLEQEEAMDVKFTKSDLELIRGVLQSVLDGTAANYREGDFGDPRHRQRVEYFLKKYESVMPKGGVGEREGEE